MDDLGAFLEHEEPRVITYIEKLASSQHTGPIDGIVLCDGSVLFRGWVYLGHAKAARAGQHVHLFAVGKARRAVAWVEKQAKPLPIPTCPRHLVCDTQPEGASAISGDIYTWAQLQPGDGPVIIYFPLRSWFGA
jgi:hypothetical protein